ncbi:MAG: hypothetical protein AAFP18_06670 [Bacteroidota bacterium]
MPRPLLLALALVASSATAQIAPLNEVRTLAIPLVVQTGSVDYGPDVTASGASSIVPGFSVDRLDRSGPRMLYRRFDISGGAAFVACYALSCSGLTEEINGVESDNDGWVYLEGLLIPLAEGGVLFPTPVGSLGGGVTLGSAGVAGGTDTFAYGLAGVQGAYGAQFGPVTVLSLATYGVGYSYGSGEGGLTGRVTKLRTDAYIPIGRFMGIGTLTIARVTDTLGTDDSADDLGATFVTFGAGIGF